MTIIYATLFTLFGLTAAISIIIFFYLLIEDSHFNGLILTVFIACIITIFTLNFSNDYIFKQRLNNNEGYMVQGVISYPKDDYGKKYKPSDEIIVDGKYFEYDVSFLKKSFSINDIKEGDRVKIFVISDIFNDYVREVVKVEPAPESKKESKKKSKK